MSTIKSNAVVIKRMNIGESDRVLTLFTREEGVLSAIAKGSRKMKSRYASSTNLFTVGNYVLSTGKTFFIVSDTEILSSPLVDNKDIEKIIIADAMSEAVIKFFPDKYPISDMYDIFIVMLTALNEYNPKLIYVYFISTILNKLGSFPELYRCISCHSKVTGITYFSVMSGGVYCSNCFTKETSLEITDNNVIKLWRILATSKPEIFKKLVVTDLVVDELFRILNIFIINNLQTEIRSLNI